MDAKANSRAAACAPADVLRQHAQGCIQHINMGICPDQVAGHYSRDPECPVCRALDAWAQPARGTGVQLAQARASRIYVAGPMSGMPGLNFSAFNAAAEALRAQGWHVENPADHGEVAGATWADYMHSDVCMLASCSAIHLLPGWSKSRGATLEANIAAALGMQFQYADGAEPALPAAVHDAVAGVLLELRRALTKFPTWPTDPLHAIAVVNEEVGELNKELLQLTYEPHKVKPEGVHTEALQSAAMTLRFLASMGRYEFRECVQHSQAVAIGGGAQ